MINTISFLGGAELMWHPSTGELFKVKIARQNLHDGPRLYAKVFAHHVCSFEREFVEKGAHAFGNVNHGATGSRMIGAGKIDLAKADKPTFNRRVAVAIIAEDPR